MEGRRLEISGGNVNFEGKFKNIITHNIMKQKIAIPTSEGKLSAHFGKAPEITFITIEEGKVTGQEVLKAPEHEHGAMPRFMAKNGATDILCGCLGAGAMDLVKRLGMNLHAGAPALPVDEVVKQYLEETISTSRTATATTPDAASMPASPRQLLILKYGSGITRLSASVRNVSACRANR